MEDHPSSVRIRLTPGVIIAPVGEDKVIIRKSASKGIVTLMDEDKNGKLCRMLVELVENSLTHEELKAKFELTDLEVKEFLALLENNGIAIYQIAEDHLQQKLGTFSRYVESKLSFSQGLIEKMGTNITSNNFEILVIGVNPISLRLVYNVLKSDAKSLRISSIIPMPEDGKLEILAMAEFAEKLHFYSGFNSDQGNLNHIIQNCDIVVCTSRINDIVLFEKINLACIKQQKTWILGYPDGFDMHLGSFIPGQTACYKCELTSLDANLGMSKSFVEYMLSVKDQRENSSLRYPDSLTAYHYDMLSSLAGMEVLEILLSKTGFFSGRDFCIDSASLTMRLSKLMKNPRCSVCGATENTRAPYMEILQTNLGESNEWKGTTARIFNESKCLDSLIAGN